MINKKIKPRVLGMVLVALSLGFLFLTLEIFMRFYYRAHDEKIHAGMKLLSSPVYASIGEPLSTGIHKTDEFKVTLRANQKGFRDPDHSKDDLFRIVFLGDSYTWGTGVEEDQRFGNILSRNLEIKIANLGLCTAGTINELAVYKDFSRDMISDIVILIFFPNDIQNNLWWVPEIGPNNLKNPEILSDTIENRKNQSTTWPDAKNLVLQQWYSSAFFYFIDKRLGHINFKNKKPKTSGFSLEDGTSIQISSEILSGNSNWSPAFLGFSEGVARGWEITHTAIKELDRLVKQDGKKLVVVYLPYQERIHSGHWKIRKDTFRLIVPDKLMDFDKPRDYLTQLMQSDGTELWDLTPGLEKAAQETGEELYYPINGHLTPKGNQVVAQLLEKQIKRARQQETPVQ